MCKGNLMSLKITDGNQKDFSRPLSGDARQGFIDFLAANGMTPDPKKGLVVVVTTMPMVRVRRDCRARATPEGR